MTVKHQCKLVISATDAELELCTSFRRAQRQNWFTLVLVFRSSGLEHCGFKYIRTMWQCIRTTDTQDYSPL